MKRKESYLYINDITKFNNATKLNIKPSKAKDISAFLDNIKLSSFFE